MRDFRITFEILEKFGYAQGCPGYEAQLLMRTKKLAPSSSERLQNDSEGASERVDLVGVPEASERGSDDEMRGVTASPTTPKQNEDQIDSEDNDEEPNQKKQRIQLIELH